MQYLFLHLGWIISFFDCVNRVSRFFFCCKSLNVPPQPWPEQQYHSADQNKPFPDAALHPNTTPPSSVCVSVCVQPLKFATRACINSKFDAQSQVPAKHLRNANTHTHTCTFSRNAKYRSEAEIAPRFPLTQFWRVTYTRISRRANAHSTCISVKCVCVCALMQYIGAVRSAQRALICLKQTPFLTWSALRHGGKSWL